MENDRQQFIETLTKIFESYGIGLLNDYKKLNALLMDMVPQQNKERKLICSVLQERIGSDLLKAQKETDRNIREQFLNKSIVHIKNETWISEEGAIFAVNVLAEAMGIDGVSEKGNAEEFYETDDDLDELFEEVNVEVYEDSDSSYTLKELSEEFESIETDFQELFFEQIPDILEEIDEEEGIKLLEEQTEYLKLINKELEKIDKLLHN